MVKKIEVLANLAIIVTSMVLSSVLVKTYFFPSFRNEVPTAAIQSQTLVSSGSQRRTIQAGTKVSLPGIDWSKSGRTLVLALSTTCHFCSESAPFYEQLQQKRQGDVRLVAIFPQPVEDSRNYLNKFGISVSDVVQGTLSSVGVSGTPTLLLIDNEGSVIDSWMGKLSESEAAKVMALIQQ